MKNYDAVSIFSPLKNNGGWLFFWTETTAEVVVCEKKKDWSQKIYKSFRGDGAEEINGTAGSNTMNKIKNDDGERSNMIVYLDWKRWLTKRRTTRLGGV